MKLHSMIGTMAALASVAMMSAGPTVYYQDDEPRRPRSDNKPSALKATPSDLLGKSHGKSMSKRSKRRNGARA